MKKDSQSRIEPIGRSLAGIVMLLVTALLTGAIGEYLTLRHPGLDPGSIGAATAVDPGSSPG